jgi:biopolymer transport protein ExbD
MAMSVGSEGGDDAPMSDINTTPLVDIMLVLLIIFIITVPVAIESVPITLPQTTFERTETKAENLQLTVRAEQSGACGVYLNGTYRITSNDLYTRASTQFARISKRLADQGNTDPDAFPEIHIRGDERTPYRCIGGVISIMQSAGFIKVGFISEPE